VDVVTAQLGIVATGNRHKEKEMKCYHCRTVDLIWGGDHDIDHEDDTYAMVTNLSCPKCESIVDVYYPKEKEDE
jgi:phage FluMu protein Com